MCQYAQLPSTTASLAKQSELGQTEKKSTSSNSRADNVDTKSKETVTQTSQSQRLRKKRSTSATAECLQTDRKKTSSDKLNTCNASTPVGSSTQTSVQDSTGSEKVLKPFFDDACLEMSQRLRWHIRTDLPGSDTKYSSTSWDNVESNCCVTLKKLTGPVKQSLSKTSSALSQSLAHEFTAAGTTNRVRKLVLKINKEESQKLRQWIGCCRWTYNEALAYIKNGHEHKLTFFWLRNRFVNECNVPPKATFLLQTPKHVREGAIKDLVQAYVTNFKKRKIDPSHNFEIKFRKKKDCQSIIIPKSAFVKSNSGGFMLYPTMFSKRAIVDTAPAHDCRLSIDRRGRFVLYVPTTVSTVVPVRKNQADVVALDPGVRTFLTTWSPNGTSYKLGDGDSARLYRLMIRVDKLISEISKSCGRSKSRKQKVLNRLRCRIENIQTDMHYQCANFLTRRYNTVLIPIFGSKRMSAKLERRLQTKTVRSMLGMGHFAFRQRLKDVARLRGIEVIECTEEYTSKTCSCCGWIHPNLGGAKTFSCKSCGVKINRDLQGAFNIFLKQCRNCPGFYSGQRAANASA